MGTGLVVFFRILFVGFVGGVILMFSLSGVNRMVILSSTNTLASILILLCFSSLRGVVFFFCYMGVVGFTLITFSSFLRSRFLLMGFIGLPPFLLFQIK